MTLFIDERRKKSEDCDDLIVDQSVVGEEMNHIRRSEDFWMKKSVFHDKIPLLSVLYLVCFTTPPPPAYDIKTAS